ncbi:MAG: hypothetical protein ABFR05_00025 [Bacteroidota bacterium]
MKKTEYFTSINGTFNAAGLKTCVDDAKVKRDDFLAENKSLIGKIDSEDIKIISGNPSNNHINNVMVVIQLTYYPKK